MLIVSLHPIQKLTEAFKTFCRGFIIIRRHTQIKFIITTILNFINIHTSRVKCALDKISHHFSVRIRSISLFKIIREFFGAIYIFHFITKLIKGGVVHLDTQVAFPSPVVPIVVIVIHTNMFKVSVFHHLSEFF